MCKNLSSSGEKKVTSNKFIAHKQKLVIRMFQTERQVEMLI